MALFGTGSFKPSILQTKADESALDRAFLRGMMLVGVIAYPLSGWIIANVGLEARPDLSGRVSIAGFFLVALLASFQYRVVRDHLRKVCLGLCYLVVLHLVHQTMAGHFSATHLADFAATLCGIVMVFDRPRPLLAFLFFTAVTSAVGVYQVAEPQVPAAAVLYVLAAAGTFSCVVTRYRNRLRPSLAEAQRVGAGGE